MAGDKGGHPVAATADDLSQKCPTHDRFAILFLLADDLQQDRASNVRAAFFVDNHEIDAVENEVPDIGEGYVAAFLGVV